MPHGARETMTILPTEFRGDYDIPTGLGVGGGAVAMTTSPTGLGPCGTGSFRSSGPS